MESETNSTKISVETEFPADTSSPHTTENRGLVGGAFVEMSLSDKDSYETAQEPTGLSEGPSSLSSSVSRTTDTPARPPPPKVHYSLPRARQDPPKEVETLMRERQADEEEDADGIVYKTTTTGIRKTDSGKVYDKVHEIRETSTSTADFLRNFKVYVGSWAAPWFWISVYSILGLYPFAMIIVGAVNMKRCTIEPMIPVFMVVGGVFYLVKIAFKVYELLLEANKQTAASQSLQAAIWWRVVSAAVTMFLFAWFIAGCVWVYRAFGKGVMHHLMVDDALYCQRDVFLFAFWTVTLQIILLGIGLLGTFLLITCLMITAEKRRRTLQ